MVVHPLESVGTRRRSLRGAIPSVAVHAAILLVAVHATAHAALRATGPHVALDTLVFVPRRAPVTPPAPPTHSPPGKSRPISTESGHPVVPPLTIQDHLPPISLDTIAPVIGRRDFGEGIAHDVPAGHAVAPASGVFSGTEVDRQVEPLPGAAAPEYPDALRAAGVRGSVLAEFVVDTLGRMEPASFHALRSDDPLFAAATRAALLRTRFRPAESGGRRVRQLVQQSFSFVLR